MTDPHCEARLVVRVGVTGHRSIDDPYGVATEVRRGLELVAGLEGASGAARSRSCRFEIHSALAEGADRLVARTVMEQPDASMVVVLPFERDDYLTDFADPSSKAEFEELLAMAREVEVVPPSGSREEAYRLAGRRIVDACDVLFALWDGEPARGRGGTAEIVAYARETGVPVLWVKTNRGTPKLAEM